MARSIAGRIDDSISARVRSERGPCEQLVAEVRDRQDLVGDDPRVHVGDLGLAADEQALHPKRPDLARARRGS